jgi:cilia- and flagella-associated protein 57
LDQDSKREIDELTKQYEEKLSQESDDKVRLRGQAGIHRKHYEDLKRQMVRKEEEIRSQGEEARRRNEKIEQLTHERELILKEIQQRDVTISEDEQKMNELKNRNQELEKFKFVLDYKIKELKSQIDPRNASIAAMKSKVFALDESLESFHKKNKDLQTEYAALEIKQKELQIEVGAATKRRTDLETLIKRITNHVHETTQFILVRR